MRVEPVLNVVVYRSPGPGDESIEREAAEFVSQKSTCGLGGGLGYLVLVASDFDRLWDGVDAGDARGTAYAVLHFLGPDATEYVERQDDFIVGWVGDDKTEYGRVLLLQIIPRPHLLARRMAEQN
jgi:hypothetical protein